MSLKNRIYKLQQIINTKEKKMYLLIENDDGTYTDYNDSNIIYDNLDIIKDASVILIDFI